MSSISLEAQGVAAFKRAIDEALDSAQVLIAVGTSAANLEAEWVRYEWDSFITDSLSGNKREGRIFVYLEGVSVNELPRGLRQFQAFYHDKDSIQSLYTFITRSLDVSDINWLMKSKDEIVRLNKPDCQSTLPISLAGVAFMAHVCLVKAWNEGNLTIDNDALREHVEADGQTKIVTPDWQQVLPSLRGREFNVLLRSPNPDKFVINFDGLSKTWNSPLGETIQQRFGLRLKLRSPLEPREKEWCDWLAIFRRDGARLWIPPISENADPESIFPETERSKIQRDLNILEKLPIGVREELNRNLGERLAKFRTELSSIKDNPTASLYIGAIFFWDLVRIFAAGTQDERKMVGSIRYQTPEGNTLISYVDIAEYFVRRYVRVTPENDPGRKLAGIVLSWLDAIQEQRRKAAAR